MDHSILILASTFYQNDYQKAVALVKAESLWSGHGSLSTVFHWTKTAGSFFIMYGFLYILRSEKSGHYYIGSTSNPDQRLIRHNTNAVRATRNKGHWERVALVEFKTVQVARKAECFIKRQKSRRIIELIITGDFIWPDNFS